MRSFLWAFVLSLASAVPFDDKKIVSAADASGTNITIESSDEVLVIEAGSGPVNIVINQVVATVTAAPCAATPAEVPQLDSTAYEHIEPSVTVVQAYTAAQETHTLAPEVHLLPTQPGLPEHAHPSACAPQPSMTLYYGATTTGMADSAVLTIPELTYPAVNAHLADAITSVVCKGSSATVTFRDADSYDVAVNTWYNAGLFQILTFSDTCGSGTSNGEHDFILVHDVTSHSTDSLSLVCTISIIDFEHAVGTNTNMTIDIGGKKSGCNDPTKPGNNGNTSTPASCSGATFDEDLDDSLGARIDLADPSTWSQAIPNVTADEWEGDYDTDDLPDLYERRKRSLNTRVSGREQFRRDLRKRGLWEAAKRAWNSLPKPNLRLPTPGEIYTAAEEAARKTLGVLNKWISIDKDFDKQLKFKEYPSNPLGESDFGTGFKIYDNGQLAAYCVGCGAQADLQANGRLQFSIGNGLTAGFLSVNGFLQATAKLGIIGSVSKTINLGEAELLLFTLGDLLVPGVLKLGPSARIGAGGFVSLDASGSLLAGTTLTWGDIDFLVDVVNVDASRLAGFAPTAANEFKVDGQVSATLDGHLTIALGFAIGLISGKFTRSIEIVDQPGIQVTAGIQGSAEFNGGFSSGFTGKCRGVSLSAIAYNNVTANILDVKTFPLSNYQSPDLVSKCYGGSGDQGNDFEPEEEEGGQDDGEDDNGADDGDADDGDDDDDGGDDDGAAEKRKRSLVESQHSHQHYHRRQIAGSNATSTESPSAVSTSGSSTSQFPQPTDGIYSFIVSDDSQWELHWGQNGNVYVITSNGDTDSLNASPDDTSISTSDITGLFGTTPLTNNGAVEKPYIISDSIGRALHGYNNELDTYGVSRLRLHQPNALPATSVLVAFGSADDPNDGTPALVLFDTAGDVYYPVICAYSDCYPKLFLAKDAFTGPELLENLPAITGEGNLTCSYMPLFGNGNNNGV